MSDAVLVARKYTEAGDSLSDLLAESYDKIGWLEHKVLQHVNTLNASIQQIILRLRQLVRLTSA